MFAKLGRYFMFICRRERAISPIWIAGIAGMAALIAAIYPDLLPDQAAINQMAASMANPAMVAMMGNVYGMEKLTQASVMAQECLIWFLLTAAIMNIFLVNRHSRADEELGRLEMFRALSVGRLTSSLAVMAFAFLLNLLISLFTAALLLAVNVGGTTVGGALAYGSVIGSVGLLFAALTLLAAQLFSTARSVSGFAFAAMLLFYMLRASGDVSGNALSSISPLGLGLKIEAFHANKVCPIALLLAESILLTGIALVVHAARDHGAGIIPARAGRAHASPFLQSPLGYAWRITRGGAFGWAAGMFLLGASYGSVCPELGAFVEKNELMQKIIEQSGGNVLLDNYVAMIFVIMAMVTSVPVILAALRIYNEEKRGRLEQIYARSVPRVKLYGAFLIVAFFESILLQLLLAAGLWAAAGGELVLGAMVKSALVHVPAIWLMAGITVLLVGLIPKLTPLIWAVFGYSFLILYIGRMADLPEWTTRLAPFGNTPQMPVQEFRLAPLLLMTAMAVLFAAGGLWRYSRRDVG